MVEPPLVAGALAALYSWQAREGSEGVDVTGAERPIAVPPPLLERLESFSRSESPRECCGIGIGPAGRVLEFHPVPNVHPEPVTRYEIAPGDQLRIYERALERGWDVTLVFHTHPATEAYPSATDISLAAWPDATYAIMSLAGEDAVLRAFRIVDGQVRELPVQA